MPRRSQAGSGAFTLPGHSEQLTGSSADARSGYLLIEVAITLAVTGMVLAMALPVVGHGTTSAGLLALTNTATSLLRDARTTAVARNKVVAATFDAPHRTLRAGLQAVLIPPDVGFALVAGGNCPADGARAQILFRPDGTNCGGVLRFTKGLNVLRARINWVNGRIDVVEGP